jgi:hypothetical protein
MIDADSTMRPLRKGIPSVLWGWRRLGVEAILWAGRRPAIKVDYERLAANRANLPGGCSSSVRLDEAVVLNLTELSGELRDWRFM